MCVESISRGFPKVSRVFQDFLLVFYGSFKEVCKQVSSCFIRVLRKLYGSFI